MLPSSFQEFVALYSHPDHATTTKNRGRISCVGTLTWGHPSSVPKYFIDFQRDPVTQLSSYKYTKENNVSSPAHWFCPFSSSREPLSYKPFSERKSWSHQEPSGTVRANNNWGETWTEAHLRALQKFRSGSAFRNRNISVVTGLLPWSQS